MDTPDDFYSATLDAVLDAEGIDKRLDKLIESRDLAGIFTGIVPDIAFLQPHEIAAFKIKLKAAFPKDFRVKDYDTCVRDFQHKSRVAADEEARPASDDWRNHLDMTDSGKVGDSLQNAAAVLQHHPEWKGKLAYDEFMLEIVALEDTPVSEAGPWSDLHDLRATEWMQKRDVRVNARTVSDATTMVSQNQVFHPVKDYLDGLEWDNTPRIDSWLTNCFGAKQTNYTAAVGAKWLISAVARIYDPGCKVDTCLILEGLQDQKKSTSLKILGGKWFTDEMADMGSKDSQMQMMGAWIIEISELDAMSRSEVSKVKSFMSRATERFRPPYGRKVISVPRQCVFAGTVNHDEYLTDSTGNRRFWPVYCNKNDVNQVEEDRDQLWAEAVYRYRDSSPEQRNWWLTLEIEIEAREEQELRRQVDPYVHVLEQFTESREGEFLPTLALLKEVVGADRPATPQDGKRVSSAMLELGWAKVREEPANSARRVRGYRVKGDTRISGYESV